MRNRQMPLVACAAFALLASQESLICGDDTPDPQVITFSLLKLSLTGGTVNASDATSAIRSLSGKQVHLEGGVILWDEKSMRKLVLTKMGILPADRADAFRQDDQVLVTLKAPRSRVVPVGQKVVVAGRFELSDITTEDGDVLCIYHIEDAIVTVNVHVPVVPPEK